MTKFGFKLFYINLSKEKKKTTKLQIFNLEDACICEIFSLEEAGTHEFPNFRQAVVQLCSVIW